MPLQLNINYSKISHWNGQMFYNISVYQTRFLEEPIGTQHATLNCITAKQDGMLTNFF